MSKFLEQLVKESKKYGITLYNEAADEQSSTEQPQPTEQPQQPQQPANAEGDPFPERFVYVAGLLQKALLDKFPSLMNIEKITQDNVGQIIQNMENLMKQAGMTDDIDTKNVNI